MTKQPSPTPQQAYNTARAVVQREHVYTTEGIHAVCSCGTVGTVESIGDHIEELASKAGNAAREAVVQQRITEHEVAEAQKRLEKEAAMEAARRAVAAEQ